MASATTTYNFTGEEVSHLANCNTQDDFLFNFQRILQTKGIDVETTRQLCLRAAQQKAGSSPVTAVAIGSGSAALVG